RPGPRAPTLVDRKVDGREVCGPRPDVRLHPRDEPPAAGARRAAPRGSLAALRGAREGVSLPAHTRHHRALLPAVGRRAPRSAPRLPRPAPPLLLGAPRGPPSQRARARHGRGGPAADGEEAGSMPSPRNG